MSFVSFIVAAGIIITFILSLIAIVLYNQKKEIPDDRVKILNFLKNYTKGNYAEGYMINNNKGEKRSLIEYIPTDINYKKTQKIENQKIVAENNKIISLPKGTLSNNESVLWILPPSADDFPNELKNSYFGKMLMAIVEQINENTEENEIIKSRMKAQTDILKDTKGMQLVRDFIREDKNLTKDFLKKVSFRDDKDKSSYTSPGR